MRQHDRPSMLSRYTKDFGFARAEIGDRRSLADEVLGGDLMGDVAGQK